MRPADRNTVRDAVPILVDCAAPPADFTPLVRLLARLAKEATATKSCQCGKSGGRRGPKARRK
jgi:hypothetical protein